MEKEGQQQVNAYTDKDTDHTDDEDYNDKDYSPELETAPKRQKRHTPEQIRELIAAYQQCDHPDEPTRRALGARIGLGPMQVKYWFQNQRSQMQAKALVQNSKAFQKEKAALIAENVSLRKALLTKSCFTCGGATAPAELTAENRRLVMENARLRDECMGAKALLSQILSAPPAERPPVVARGQPTALSVSEGASSRADHTARLLAHAESAMEQFLLLATKGEPVWQPTPDGEVLKYQNKMLPVHHEVCPDECIVEATRATGMVRADAAYLVAMLTDAKRWAELFPSIVAGVTASDAISSGGVLGSHLQLMKAELRVQSPRVPNRRINFLRYTKPVAQKQWAVIDVSVDGILETTGSHIGDAIANNTIVPARYTGCRLLPSGCLIEDRHNRNSRITWVVHTEYNETTVPPIFRPLFRLGKAFGAQRWLASLQRQSEYLAVLHSSRVPRGDNTASAAISSTGKRGILELAQRMMAVFYSDVSGPVTQTSSKVCEWPATAGTGAERIDAPVRMVTWKKAGSVADLLLSASTTVWLPNTLPQDVFQYLCNGQRRGEWDLFAKGAAVTELCSVPTGHLQGNAVSVLYSNVTTDNKKVMILQQACTDASCSMLVYAPVEEDFMCAVMNGGGHTSVFLMPSGFAVLPDGHNRARHGPSSSSAPVARVNTTGSLLTVAYQALLPGLSSTDNHAADRAFDEIGKLLCGALQKIKAAVKANAVIPA